MKWDEFLESKSAEAVEEKSGIDADHDKEKGEPAAHKAKVEAKHKEVLEFFKKRKAGAAKIATEAHAKGGASILTYWHFSAKTKPYNEVLQAIQNGRNEAWFMSKCKSAMSSIHCGRMTQRKFQETMGVLEVWGEALAQLFGKAV